MLSQSDSAQAPFKRIQIVDKELNERIKYILEIYISFNLQDSTNYQTFKTSSYKSFSVEILKNQQIKNLLLIDGRSLFCCDFNKYRFGGFVE